MSGIGNRGGAADAPDDAPGAHGPGEGAGTAQHAGEAAGAPDGRRWTVPSHDDWRGWLDRPELRPPPEACRAERALHAALRADPLRAVSPAEVARLADADARENFGHFLRLRDGVAAAGSWEGWLLQRWRGGRVDVPPLFVDCAIDAVLGTLLAGDGDAAHWRAAELLVRPQRVARHDGRWLAGDRETLDLQRQTHGFGDIGRLLAQSGQPVRAVEMQVLGPANAAAYLAERAAADRAAPGTPARRRFLLDLTHTLTQDWGHGLTVGLAAAGSGLPALAQVLERWVRHFLGVAVTIVPRARIDDERWRWHLGLDAESSRLLDDLYLAREVEPTRLQRLIALFALAFDDPAEQRADVAGRPVYLGLAADADGLLRVKPQNLLLNLPLARGS